MSFTNDTVRILVSTDNHVGYSENDAVRGDDSWKTFHEIMCLAKARDVDMVLLAGDLFHENKPSRKAMYQVMRSLRMNCYGEKPCELEMLSDASETFPGAFNHVNYEDPDINVAIPVFSIHGNHDDPTGEGGYAPLDLLQMSGLLNYYGRVPESDNIHIKPVLLQKGHTKIALYGLSNVRDERLFRTFRDGNVKFYQPNQQKDDWYNIMSVHQNHHPYTETGYLPENFLPSFLDLVIWGHEHECKINPITNPETNFRVMQPGSSVATSLVPGEAVPKYVAILNITGKTLKVENIRLKTVRPFISKEIVLADNKQMRELAMKSGDIKPKITRYLEGVIEEMIGEAKQAWFRARREAGEQSDVDEAIQPPLPLIRLRVEYTPPEGGKFDTENPQRFSNRFIDKVANVNDVVQFYRKRSSEKRSKGGKAELPDAETLAELQFDSVKVSKLVQEFLAAQSLTILPQNTFADALREFVDKDEKDAMSQFIKDSLEKQVRHLVGDEDGNDEVDEEKIYELMEQYRGKQEELFAKNGHKGSVRKRPGSRKPKPDDWNSEEDGHWEDDPLSFVREADDEEAEANHEVEYEGGGQSSRGTSGRGRGRGRGAKATTGTSRKAAATTKKASAKSGRGKQPARDEEEAAGQDEEGDVVMLDDEEQHVDSLFVQPAPVKKAPATKTAKKSSNGRSAANGTQSTLNFGIGETVGRKANGTAPKRSTATASRATTSRAASTRRVPPPSEEEISDDDDAFEPPATSSTGRTR